MTTRKHVDAAELDDAGAEVVIEARDGEHDWDMDYVGTSMTLAEAREYVQKLRDNTAGDGNDWRGWEFRIVGLLDSCYCGIVREF